MYVLEKWSAPIMCGEDSKVNSSFVISDECQVSYTVIQRTELHFCLGQVSYGVLYTENRHINFW